MSKYLTKGNITAVLGVAAVIAGALGKSQLAAVFADPDFAGNVLTVIGGVLAALGRLGVKTPE